MKEAVSIENSVLFPEIFKLLEEGHTVTLGLKGFSMRPFLENNRDKAVLVKGDGLEKGRAGTCRGGAGPLCAASVGED